MSVASTKLETASQPAERPTKNPTLFLQCPVCRSDDAEPVGVADAMADAEPAAVILLCDGCRAVWLSPPPVKDAGDEDPASRGWSPDARRLRRWTSALPSTAEILVLDGDAPDLPPARPDARYDLIVLPYSLEAAADPAAFLSRVAALLASGGRAISITGNVDSACCRRFLGRHWSGYRYPQARQFFGGEAMHALCAREPLLSVERIESAYSARAWLASTRNWLRDWGAPRGLIGLLTGRWGLPQAAAASAEAIATLRGRGGLLVTELVKR